MRGDGRGASAARVFFLAQGVVGAAWWAALPLVSDETLGAAARVPAVAVGMLLLSAVSVCAGLRVPGAAWVSAVGMAGVGVGFGVFATITGTAGWGAVLTLVGAAGSAAALIVDRAGRVPVERLLVGPFRFRPTRMVGRAKVLGASGLQILVFSAALLVGVPAALAVLEDRWGLRLEVPMPVRAAGLVVFAAAALVSVWSVVSMSVEGRGTPVPSAMPHRLVTAGPYGIVRNPMAVGGIGQAMGVGLVAGSWMVLVYALAGAVFWHTLIRPAEEADLETRFGEQFRAYRAQVACWVPRWRRRGPLQS
ncbi:isoprenylcysteine carboxylmethyltransferase family protein [Streptomyces sp. AC495_CC817]|uniref:methyltransferase family protein n=1 Tax=Streptomyces sp. AC495_CC817 TaxID=2823900 RepID=UPI001C25EA5A|nr:isoprenylcysteine carboxylmethyltransferase family protein [Streptomyces sp. AC495_CC817]